MDKEQEVTRRIEKALTARGFDAAKTASEEATEELAKVKAFRAERAAGVREMVEKVKGFGSSLSDLPNKREASRRLQDAEEDLKDIDATILPNAEKQVAAQREALREIKRAAIREVYQWASLRFQEKVSELDDFGIAWTATISDLGGADLSTVSLPVEEASIELIEAFKATQRLKRSGMPHPWLERRS